MKRHELELLIRAAGAITGAEEIIVIGSQAILASMPDAPESLLASREAALFTLRDPKDADLIDGSIGEGSPFHHRMIDGEIQQERIARLDVSADEKTAGRERWQRISGTDG